MFSKRVQVHHKLMAMATPAILDEIGKTWPTPGGIFAIGDYGSADGGTSFELIKKAIALLRSKHGDNLPIQIIYEDLPINDFTPVFIRAESLCVEVPSVYVVASGTSFYSQCMPTNSMDIIVSFSAVLYLSKRPEVYSVGLFPSVFCTVAREVDWENFLLLRSKELKPGGCLVVTSLDLSEDESVMQQKRAALSHIGKIWEEIYKEGLITQREYENTHTFVYYRSVAELEEPFRTKVSAVTASGLKLIAVYKHTAISPFRLQWEELISGGNNDPEAIINHARSVADELRSWQERFLSEGLDEHRTAAEREYIIDECYERYSKLVATDPPSFHADEIQICLVIRKKAA